MAAQLVDHVVELEPIHVVRHRLLSVVIQATGAFMAIHAVEMASMLLSAVCQASRLVA
jgi:hypothetical protein